MVGGWGLIFVKPVPQFAQQWVVLRLMWRLM
jgi:hypothetical protein